MDAHNAPKRIRQTLIAFLFGSLVVIAPLAAAAPGAETEALIGLSLEELLQVTVTSVSRKPQSLSASPAAIFVISQDDIRRSGARTIPDLLRMVPGMQVAQVDSSTWAVTARGSNGIFADKLLVLMDGRTLYDPLFSGVYWENQDTNLESIDRIEVIRGPGAALWGANAVNGVINIITKNSKDTHGFKAAVAAGTSTKIETNVQWGGGIGDDIDYRVFGKYFSRDGFATKQSGDVYDDWNIGRVGGRLDWSVGGADTITVTSEYYDGDVGQNVLNNSLTPPSSVSQNIDRETMGVFVNVGWDHIFSETSDLSIKTYYDHREHDNLSPRTDQDAFDLDLQHRFRLWSRHDIVWGFGIRNNSDKTIGDDTIMLNPNERTQRLYSGFIQDEIRLIGDEVFATLGTKIEKSNFSPGNDWEWSPNLRLNWLISDTNTLWGSVARAIRTPSRIEQNGRILGFVDPPFSPTNPDPFAFALTINGDPTFDNEEVTAYEIGYRAQPLESITVDVALFLHHYEDIRLSSTQPLVCQPAGLPISDPGCFMFGLPDYLELAIDFVNQTHEDTKGIEIAISYSATDWWRIYSAYSYLDIDSDAPTNLPITTGADSPEHQLSVRSNINLGDTINLDIWARFIDELKVQNVDDYFGLDVRLAWQALPSLELRVVGRNLIESSHLEFREETGENISVEVDREFFAELLWQF